MTVEADPISIAIESETKSRRLPMPTNAAVLLVKDITWKLPNLSNAHRGTVISSTAFGSRDILPLCPNSATGRIIDSQGSVLILPGRRYRDEFKPRTQTNKVFQVQI